MEGIGISVSLSNLIWLSEKRKNVLLLLHDGPRSLSHILKALNMTVHSLSPQIKILLDESLIYEKSEDFYELTEIGYVVVKNMYPLFNTLTVLEEDIDYWKERDFSEIPLEILEKIGDLGNYMLMEPDLSYHYDIPEEFTINLKDAVEANVLFSYYHPVYVKIIMDLFETKPGINCIFVDSVFSRIVSEMPDHITDIINNKKANLYVYSPKKEGSVPSFFLTDIFSFFFFFNKNKVFENRQIMSFDPSSLEWGNLLFKYFLSLSSQITLNDL